MKLEFKEIVGYLPWDIKARCDKTTYIHSNPERVGIIDSWNKNDNEISISTGSGYFLCDISDCKLLLHPLSDLTKEINLECEGQFIVGGERIRDWHDLDPMRCNYEQLTYLLEHHYDIHGLIKEGLAIDINTL